MNKRTVGKEKEILASKYLEANGYTVIEMNYNSRHGEVDIISTKGGYICFVEVKYRKSTRSGIPEEAVSLSKMKKICKTADYYMYTHKTYNLQMRFDVIAIENDEIRFYENAFWHIN